MHAPNLLKVVLKPRSSASDSSARSGSSGDNSGGGSTTVNRSTSDSALDALAKELRPARSTACLCAPTKHAGSFRCRLHRASQTQWVSCRSSGASSAAKADALSSSRSFTEQKKRPAITKRSPSFSPPRSPESRSSRLSKGVVAASKEGASDAAGFKKSSDDKGPVDIARFFSASGPSASVVSEMMVI